MTDLERFFRRLVENLASTDPARLHRPLPLAELQRDIVPYRANRRALELESSEDYEMVLLRLCAGEGGLVRIEPEEARARFARELRAPNPDLGLLHAFEHVVLTLRSEPLARALDPARERAAAYAPPETDVSELARLADKPRLGEISELDDISEGDELLQQEPAEPKSAAGEPAAPRCLYCAETLPAQRAVSFCPHCGRSQTVPTCSRCRSELEPGWKHCVNCGTAVGGG
ncbi:MAG: hypothetical protein H0T68_05935 [Gemmatimonadales bacterium]|nr:hypothetical protein [Gemmatimonadales bacterium]